MGRVTPSQTHHPSALGVVLDRQERLGEGLSQGGRGHRGQAPRDLLTATQPPAQRCLTWVLSHPAGSSLLHPQLPFSSFSPASVECSLLPSLAPSGPLLHHLSPGFASEPAGPRAAPLRGWTPSPAGTRAVPGPMHPSSSHWSGSDPQLLSLLNCLPEPVAMHRPPTMHL